MLDRIDAQRGGQSPKKPFLTALAGYPMVFGTAEQRPHDAGADGKLMTLRCPGFSIQRRRGGTIEAHDMSCSPLRSPSVETDERRPAGPEKSRTSMQSASGYSSPVKDARKTLKPGDAVSWSSVNGTVTGKVKRKLTAPTQIKGHHVAASEDNPEYLVESDKTGAQAAHKPESLRKK